MTLHEERCSRYLENLHLKRFAVNIILCNQKALLCETADDRAQIEELRKKTEEAHRGSSTMDDMIAQQTADMEQAECRLRAREHIFKDNQKRVDELAQQAVKIESQIKDNTIALELSNQQIDEKMEAAEEAASTLLITQERLEKAAKGKRDQSTSGR